MPCSRGRVDPTRVVTLRLFAASGGYCQSPTCLRELFLDTKTASIHLAEAAHIIAASDTGPRSDQCSTAIARSAYENLILLCPSCHTIIDKLPHEYTDSTLRQWKRNHIDRIAVAIGAVKVPDRQSARRLIEPALRENGRIFVDYNPNRDYRFDPESEVAQIWQRKMRSRILPNNRKILLVLDKNLHLLTEDEVATLEEFRQHVEELEERHIGPAESLRARRFPPKMTTILTEEHNV